MSKDTSIASVISSIIHKFELEKATGSFSKNKGLSEEKFCIQVLNAAQDRIVELRTAKNMAKAIV
jgi:hypothetical protein